MEKFMANAKQDAHVAAPDGTSNSTPTAVMAVAAAGFAIARQLQRLGDKVDEAMQAEKEALERELRR